MYTTSNFEESNSCLRERKVTFSNISYTVPEFQVVSCNANGAFTKCLEIHSGPKKMSSVKTIIILD